MEYPELKRSVLSCAKKWNVDIILIEDKASGQSLLQDLKIESSYSLVAIKPVADKITRFAQTTAIIETGRVYLPKSSSWLNDYEIQLLGFPNAAHDDMVDSTSQFLNWVKKTSQKEFLLRKL